MSEDIIDVLRAFGTAYQEKFFRPLTDADRKLLDKDNLNDRCAAEMGRYLATWMTQAADEIERLRERITEYAIQSKAGVNVDWPDDADV